MADEQLCAKLIKKREIYYKRMKSLYDLSMQAQVGEVTRLNDFRSGLDDLANCVASFESLHLDIIGLTKDEDLDQQHSIGTRFDSMRYSVRSIAREVNPPSRSEGNNQGLDEKSMLLKQGITEALELPRISVPTFSGNRRDWFAFHDLFRTLVHDRDNLTNIQRFQYLRMALKGEAEEVIRNIPLTSDNYAVAYDALVQRYENKRALATDYWLAIYNATPVKNGSVSDLRGLITSFTQNLDALNCITEIDLWDFTKLNLMLQKIDPALKRSFEIEHSSRVIPRYVDLMNFLNRNCRALENSVLFNEPKLSVSTLKQPDSRFDYKQKRLQQARSSKVFMTSTDSSTNCGFCLSDSPHLLIRCKKFLDSDVSGRHQYIKNNRLCFNCFGRHGAASCKVQKFCKVPMCGQKHNSLLHFPTKNGRGEKPKPSENSHCEESSIDCASTGTQCYTSLCTVENPPLFATAEVSVCNSKSQLMTCRAMLDCASQISFVSLSCVQRLGLQLIPSDIPIQGINNMSTASSLGLVDIILYPKDSVVPSFQVRAAVVHSICELTPSSKVNPSKWKYIKNLRLADSNCFIPSGIDLLLGVDLFPEIVVPGLIKSSNNGPCAIKTVFGWVLVGGRKSAKNEFVSLCTSVSSPSPNTMDCNLQKFWELESVPQKIPLLPEEQQYEDFFASSHSRDSSGRYIVRLPFRNGCPEIGDTKGQALRRFNLLESRLIKNPTLHVSYIEFMRDYLDQNHMEVCTSSDAPSYYLPHHCVVKNDNGVLKTRVVFDGNNRGVGGSLNDALLVGPKLQNDIVKILMNFRFFPIVFSTDIRQMYRNILVDRRDVGYQKILWRFDIADPIHEYQLLTVTYGLNCSPFLAIRTLHQLAKDHGQDFPLASDILVHSTYIDDIIGYARSVDEALEIQKQLIKLLDCGKFELRKWTSNCEELLASVPESHQQNISFSDSDSSVLKILGLQWNPVSDVFSYSVKPIDRDCTKRVILSEIAKIYDPLGLIAPVVLVAKSLIQRLWLEGLGWDETPPLDVVNQWQLYASQLPILSSVVIPRCVTVNDVILTELHGFSDASLVAYGGVVYVRQIDSSGVVHISLLCAKSKVCPLKMVSVPRLEICAALLLSHLIEYVLETCPIKFDQIYAWSDSSVALYWIKNHPSRWKPFVANRVCQIQDKVPPNRWFHISGSENPADCLSRGLLPNQFIDHSLWFTGPPWLKVSNELWTSSLNFDLSSNPSVSREERKVVLTVICPQNPMLSSLLQRFSSLKTIQHIVAYCVRFMKVSAKIRTAPASKALSSEELYKSMCLMVKLVQRESFSEELKNLQSGKPCSKPIRKLAPFLDSEGVIRVGGRLRHSDLSFDTKHPMLLPKDHRLTSAIIVSFHEEHGHPGPRHLQYLLRQQFWIVSIGRLIHSVLSKCFRCARVKPSPYAPFMGDLPKIRVSQVKPFSHCGVDYLGPIQITMSRRRGVQSQKGYICIFVCMSTKAIHLEAVSDLSSEAFLGCFRRFVARRGRCSDIYSDRGTNFKGAEGLLLSYIKASAEKLSIKWHFNPPAAPHFGGLWESGVKSVKTQLSHVIGHQILSFEEISTVLAQCESTLNSRPLCEMSPNPNDLECLTPGHFLTLEALTAPPDEDLSDIPTNRLKRWQLIQQIHQSFWKRWSLEYLTALQQRQKWNVPNVSPIVGSLVVIKDNNQPPLKWLLARVEKIYPSPDNIPRVVQVRTSKGLLERPLVKICPLPSQ